MRVIGGDARGAHLKGPPDKGTRATADKVREAMFHVLASSIESGRVLDLPAGTGALGIEALS
ncbi:MAG: RsmD family RNA methyltransferase, partial [Chloroflexota bacterium]